MGSGAPLVYRLVGTALVPAFLGEHDWPWLRRLLDERERFVGRPRRELDARLEIPRPENGPPGKTRLAVHVLSRLERGPDRALLPPRQARRLVFAEASRTGEPRRVVLGRVASVVGVSPERLETALFADLPGERLVVDLVPPPSPGEIALRANLTLAQALLFRATAVEIEAEGNARALVRHAQLAGLISTVTGRTVDEAFKLEVSGPFALFRHTLLYGRALGRLVPLLAWCRRFRLRASCVLDGSPRDLELATGDPIFPAAEPQPYDSQVEARFARMFRRLAQQWDVIREPEPIAAGPLLVFPDFALQHRRDPARRWLLEIVGFWTPDYLRRKLALYRAAGIPNLILCIDADRGCADGELPAGARVVRFRGHVDVTAVQHLVEGSG